MMTTKMTSCDPSNDNSELILEIVVGVHISDEMFLVKMYRSLPDRQY